MKLPKKPLSEKLSPAELEMRDKFATAGLDRELAGAMSFSVMSMSYSHPGPIEIEVRPDGMRIRWYGDVEWKDMLWHDAVLFAGAADKVWKENLEWERERAYNEMVVGVDMAETAQADWNRRQMAVMEKRQSIAESPVPKTPSQA